jgi:hypothetical protein
MVNTECMLQSRRTTALMVTWPVMLTTTDTPEQPGTDLPCGVCRHPPPLCLGELQYMIPYVLCNGTTIIRTLTC